MIKKGCLLATAVLLGLFAGYFWLLRGRIELFPTVLLAGFGSIGLVMFVSQLKEVLLGPSGAAPLKRAEQGLPLEDGREEAVWGPIEPLGPVLEAPFSGRACIAYEYDAKPAGDSAASAMAGFALAPSVIRSNRGDVHLLGFSALEKFKETSLRDDEARERAARWVAATEFRPLGITKLGAMISAYDEAMTDDDGSVRMDLRDADVSVEQLVESRLKEKSILPGDMVTAIGLWDQAKGGLVPKHRGKTVMVTVTPGGGAAAVAKALERPWGTFLFSIIWAGGVHAVIALVVMKFPR